MRDPQFLQYSTVRTPSLSSRTISLMGIDGCLDRRKVSSPAHRDKYAVLVQRGKLVRPLN